MSSNSTYCRAAIALVVLGLLIPWWPLAAVGVAIAALSGSYAVALICALVLDLLWGKPIGHLAFIPMPMVALAMIASLLRILGGKLLLSKMPDRL